MSSVRWSQFNDDSSSVSSASSGLEDIIGSPVKKTNIVQPIMKKIQSSPPQFKQYKQKKLTNQQKIAENIDKLSNHKDKKVWLYVPDYSHNEQQTVHQILKQTENFEEVHQMKQGWNVQIKTEKAGEYLEKGLIQKGLNLKFIFSSKNDHKNGDYKNDYKNDHKKYQEKNDHKKYQQKKRSFVSPNSRLQDAKSPKIKNKKTYTEKNPQNNIKEDRGVQAGKKKVKYVARQEKNNNDEKLKNYNPQTQIKQQSIIKDKPSQQLSNNVIETHSKQQKQIVESKIESQNNKVEIPKSFEDVKQSIKDISKNKLPQKIQQKGPKKSAKEIEKPKKKQQKEQKEQKIQSDSSEQIREKIKELQKKKARKKKKNGSNNINFNDPSNPFSSLAD